MSTPSHPRGKPENSAAERGVENVATTEAFSVTAEEDISFLPEDDEEFGLRSLDDQQRAILRELTRLHRSLSGPQTMLETAGQFNRPPFPAAPPNRQPPPPQRRPH